MKTKYFVVTCWKNGGLIKERRWDCGEVDADYESNREFECTDNRKIYDKIVRTYVESETYDMYVKKKMEKGVW